MSQPNGLNLSSKAQISTAKSMSLAALELLTCYHNFNHNLLWQGTGTADHLTLLRLFYLWPLGWDQGFSGGFIA